jgi:hypothetical protein
MMELAVFGFVRELSQSLVFSEENTWECPDNTARMECIIPLWIFRRHKCQTAPTRLCHIRHGIVASVVLLVFQLNLPVTMWQRCDNVNEPRLSW